MKHLIPKVIRADATYEELLGPLVHFRSKKSAAAYLEALTIARVATAHASFEKAKKLVLADIGYWTGYLPKEQAIRVQKLFCSPHPIFGYTEE